VHDPALRPTRFRTARYAAALTGLLATAAVPASPRIPLGDVQRDAGGIEAVPLTASPADAQGELHLVGRVDADGRKDAVVLAPVAARVVAVQAYPGARVRRGQPLATLGGPSIAESAHTLRATEAVRRRAEAQRDRDAGLVAEGVIARNRLERSEADLVQAQAEWEHARHVVEAGSLSEDGLLVRAPRDGVLQGPSLSPGDALEPGAVVARIGSGEGRRVLLLAPPAIARQLAVGDAVRVSTRGCAAAGQVSTVGATVDPSTQAVTVAADVPGGACVLAGEAVTATVAPVRHGDGGTALPATAFVRRAGAVYVFVEAPGGYDPVAVDAQAAAAGFARAAELRPGTRVVVRGAAVLKSAWLAQPERPANATERVVRQAAN
jgi:biotin carboxyl carrier protein